MKFKTKVATQIHDIFKKMKYTDSIDFDCDGFKDNAFDWVDFYKETVREMAVWSVTYSNITLILDGCVFSLYWNPGIHPSAAIQFILSNDHKATPIINSMYDLEDVEDKCLEYEEHWIEEDSNTLEYLLQDLVNFERYQLDFNPEDLYELYIGPSNLKSISKGVFHWEQFGFEEENKTLELCISSSGVLQTGNPVEMPKQELKSIEITKPQLERNFLL